MRAARPFQVSRRRLLAGAGAAWALPYLVPAQAFGANAKMLTGHIGVGGQGTSNLKRLKTHAIAVCDVDEQRAAEAQKLVAETRGKCDVFGDFRKLLQRKDIDAVVVSTPDHWHALPTVVARARRASTSTARSR